MYQCFNIILTRYFLDFVTHEKRRFFIRLINYLLLFFCINFDSLIKWVFHEMSLKSSSSSSTHYANVFFIEKHEINFIHRHRIGGYKCMLRTWWANDGKTHFNVASFGDDSIYLVQLINTISSSTCCSITHTRESNSISTSSKKRSLKNRWQEKHSNNSIWKISSREPNVSCRVNSKKNAEQRSHARTAKNVNKKYKIFEIFSCCVVISFSNVDWNNQKSSIWSSNFITFLWIINPFSLLS